LKSKKITFFLLVIYFLLVGHSKLKKHLVVFFVVFFSDLSLIYPAFLIFPLSFTHECLSIEIIKCRISVLFNLKYFKSFSFCHVNHIQRRLNNGL